MDVRNIGRRRGREREVSQYQIVNIARQGNYYNFNSTATTDVAFNTDVDIKTSSVVIQVNFTEESIIIVNFSS